MLRLLPLIVLLLQASTSAAHASWNSRAGTRYLRQARIHEVLHKPGDPGESLEDAPSSPYHAALTSKFASSESGFRRSLGTGSSKPTSPTPGSASPVEEQNGVPVSPPATVAQTHPPSLQPLSPAPPPPKNRHSRPSSPVSARPLGPKLPEPAPLPPSDDVAQAPGVEVGGFARTTRKAQLAIPVTKTKLPYAGGSVMADPIRVYLVFYGKWDPKGCGPRVLTSLMNSISDSKLAKSAFPTTARWWRTATKCTQADGRPVSSDVSVKAVVYQNYTQGKALGLGNGLGKGTVWAAAAAAITAKTLPADPAGIYLVLTSPDVRVGSSKSKFCGDMCGFHSTATFGRQKLRYGFIGDASTQCPQTTCNLHLGKRGYSPNSCPGADGMASAVLHELAETATNPGFSSWKTKKGKEIGDLCSGKGNVGLRQDTAGHYSYNIEGGQGTRFLVQPLYDPIKGFCTLG